MVNLIVEGTYINLDEGFAYETKRKHPITSGLSDIYTAYSTDIELPLTATNVRVFDYSMLRPTSKVHKVLKGYLVKNTDVILVDVIVRKFTPKGITIFIIEKLTDQMKNLLDGVYMLDEMKPLYEDKQFIHKTVGNATPNTDFAFEPYNTQEKECPSIGIQELKTAIENEFGLVINMPVLFDYRVFCNKMKFGKYKNITKISDYNGSLFPQYHQMPRAFRAFCINNLLAGESYEAPSDYCINITTDEQWKFYFIGKITLPLNNIMRFFVDTTIVNEIIGTGTQQLVEFEVVVNLTAGQHTFNVNSNNIVAQDCVLAYQRVSEIDEDVEMDTLRDYFFDTYYNLPNITVLDFLKAVALTNGYTLKFSGNTVDFASLADYFDVANAVDMSEYFLNATQEEFTYLKYQKNNIRYGNAPPYATIEVNDETLEKEGDFLVIKEVLPTDNTNVQLWDYTDPEKPKIRVGIATVPFMGINLTTYNLVAQYLDEAFVYNANFKPCNMTGAPIYIRQLNGIFLPTEITDRTAGTEMKNVTTKLLKL